MHIKIFKYINIFKSVSGRKLYFYLTCVFFMSVAGGELKMTTRKVWDYFELEGNGKVFCKLCNVKLAYNNFTGAMRNHIQYRHVSYALAWRLAKAKCQSCHTPQPVAAVRDPIHAVYSSKRRPTSVVLRDFQDLFETVCLLVTLVISLRACDFSSCRALFLQNRL